MSEDDAFLFTRQGRLPGVSGGDFDDVIYDRESWDGADFAKIRALLPEFDALGDANFTNIQLWRALPSPTALMRLREAKLLRPEVSLESVVDEASRRFE